MMTDIALKKKLEADSCLLHGEQLRVLLNSDHISLGEVSSILREKGVFCHESDKSFTVPILSNSLLKPSEFVSLLEASVSREQTPKEKPLKITLTAKDADWISVLKDLDVAEIGQKFLDRSDISFSKEPEFRVEDSGLASISFTIERTDFSKDLLEREMQFNAKITIKKKDGELDLEIVSMHTSKETDRLNASLIRGVAGALFANGISTKSAPDQILFSSFSNKQRAQFLLKLPRNFSDNKADGKITDFVLKVDEDATMPPDLKWMEGRIKSIRAGGNDLGAVSLLSTEAYYEYYFIMRIDVEYEYAFDANSGSCLLAYVFQVPGKSQDIKSAEFVFWVDRVTHKNRVNPESAAKIKSKIYSFARRGVETAMKESLSGS